MIGVVSVFKHGASWWIRFKDPQGTPRKLRAAKSKRVADAFARRVTELKEYAAVGEAPPEQIVLWAVGLDQARLDKLMAWGLVAERHTAAWRNIDDHIEKWESGMLARGVGEGHAATQRRRVQAMVDGLQLERFADIDAEAALSLVDSWRRAGAVPGFHRKTRVSERTLAAYLKAFKAFTRWMRLNRYAPEDPMAAVSVVTRQPSPGVEVSNMAQRRALDADEQRRLTALLDDAPVRYGMAAADRRMLYRTVLGTGIRAGAVRRLETDDVTPAGTLAARGSGAVNKRTTPKPLRGELRGDLTAYARARGAGAPLFDLPDSTRLARMLRDDAAAQGINTTGVDFHCLRHTFASGLAKAGVHPKVLAELLDDSLKVAMGYYTHVFTEDLTDALERLPSLKNTAAQMLA